jgi:hypothetical protein
MGLLSRAARKALQFGEMFGQLRGGGLLSRAAREAPDAGDAWREHLRAQGFDVETPLYRGLTAENGISEGRRFSHWSPRPETANRAVESVAKRFNLSNQAVVPGFGRLQNYVEVPDFGLGWDMPSQWKMRARDGRITGPRAEALTRELLKLPDKAAVDELLDAFRRAGVDVARYRNSIEGAGEYSYLFPESSNVAARHGTPDGGVWR